MIPFGRTPTRRAARRVILLVIAVLVVYYALAMTIWPRGVAFDDLVAYNLTSHTTESVSPAGKGVSHVINNAGAGHSGLHFVWVVHRRHSWLPAQVVACGWSGFTDASESIRWRNGDSFDIWLFDTRRGERFHRITVDLPGQGVHPNE
jgi:hypothetical protein